MSSSVRTVLSLANLFPAHLLFLDWANDGLSSPFRGLGSVLAPFFGPHPLGSPSLLPQPPPHPPPSLRLPSPRTSAVPQLAFPCGAAERQRGNSAGAEGQEEPRPTQEPSGPSLPLAAPPGTRALDWQKPPRPKSLSSSVRRCLDEKWLGLRMAKRGCPFLL